MSVIPSTPTSRSFPRRLAGWSLGSLLWAHWLVRLGARALVLGVTPIIIYLAYERLTGLEGQNHASFGVLALVGLSLGVVLIGAGAVAVMIGRFRERSSSER